MPSVRADAGAFADDCAAGDREATADDGVDESDELQDANRIRLPATTAAGWMAERLTTAVLSSVDITHIPRHTLRDESAVPDVDDSPESLPSNRDLANGGSTTSTADAVARFTVPAVTMPGMALQTERSTTTRRAPATASVDRGTADRQVERHTTALLTIIVVLLVIVQWILLRDSGEWDVTPLLYWESTIVLYCVSGLLANWRQPHNPFGLLMYWAGVTIWCSGLQLAPVPGIALIGEITQSLPIAALVHLVMAYPYGRLPDRLSRTVVAILYLVSLVLQAPGYLFAGGGAAMIADLPELADAFRSVQRVVGVLGLCVALWVVLRRLRFQGADRRHRLGPLAWYGPVALLTLIAVSTIKAAFGPLPVIGILQTAVILGLPILFLAGLLGGSFSGRAGELREFLLRVGGDRLQPGDLDGAVARALGDRSARVVYGVSRPASSSTPTDPRH